MLNSNIRCIEIDNSEEDNTEDNALNSNIRCIEILSLMYPDVYRIDVE